MRFTTRKLLIFTALVAALLCCFDYEYRPPYYEAQGYISVTQYRWHFGVAYSWPAPGFDRKYRPMLHLVTPWKIYYTNPYR